MSQASAADALSQFGHAYQGAIQQNRILLENVSTFLRDESARFVSLRLERTRQAVEKLNDCRGVPGLLLVQQEWMRDVMQDWFGQGLRYSEMLQQNAGKMQAAMQGHAEEAAGAAQEMTEAAQEAVHDTVEHGRQAADDLSSVPAHENPQPFNNEPHLH